MRQDNEEFQEVIETMMQEICYLKFKAKQERECFEDTLSRYDLLTGNQQTEIHRLQRELDEADKTNRKLSDALYDTDYKLKRAQKQFNRQVSDEVLKIIKKDLIEKSQFENELRWKLKKELGAENAKLRENLEEKEKK